MSGHPEDLHRDGCWLLCCLFTTAGDDLGDPIFIILAPPLSPLLLLHRSGDAPALGPVSPHPSHNC